MKYLLAVFGIMVFGFLAQSFFEFWSVVVVAACFGALIRFGTVQGFLVGFAGVFLLWGGYAAFLNQGNDGILANKIGAMFGGLDPALLILITALLGGIIGGFGVLTGNLGRKLFN